MNDVVVDSSARVASLRSESTASSVRLVLAEAQTRFISAASLPELGLLVEGRDPTLRTERLVRELDFTVRDVDALLAWRALDAWRRWGKGRHPAALNHGDYFVYALAEARGLPVVAVGDAPAYGPGRSPIARVRS